jgi:hypothetical protein
MGKSKKPNPPKNWKNHDTEDDWKKTQPPVRKNKHGVRLCANIKHCATTITPEILANNGKLCEECQKEYDDAQPMETNENNKAEGNKIKEGSDQEGSASPALDKQPMAEKEEKEEGKHQVDERSDQQEVRGTQHRMSKSKRCKRRLV